MSLLSKRVAKTLSTPLVSSVGSCQAIASIGTEEPEANSFLYALLTVSQYQLNYLIIFVAVDNITY